MTFSRWKRPYAAALAAALISTTGCLYSTMARPGTERFKCSAPEAREAALRALAAAAFLVESSMPVGERHEIRATSSDGRQVTVTIQPHSEGIITMGVEISGPNDGSAAALRRRISKELGSER